MQLIKVHQNERENEFLGEALINLAEYAECHSRSLFPADLKQSPFPDARIEFYITAKLQSGRDKSSYVHLESPSSLQLSKSASSTQLES